MNVAYIAGGFLFFIRYAVDEVFCTLKIPAQYDLLE